MCDEENQVLHVLGDMGCFVMRELMLNAITGKDGSA